MHVAVPGSYLSYVTPRSSIARMRHRPDCQWKGELGATRDTAAALFFFCFFLFFFSYFFFLCFFFSFFRPPHSASAAVMRSCAGPHAGGEDREVLALRD